MSYVIFHLKKTLMFTFYFNGKIKSYDDILEKQNIFL